MDDQAKSKAQLIEELRAAREKLCELEPAAPRGRGPAERDSRPSETEARLGALMDCATDGFLIFDSSLALVELNAAAVAMFPDGTTREDLLGRSITQLQPGLEKTERYGRYLNTLHTGEPFVAELRGEEPGRVVELEVPPELATSGDRVLLRAALDNLLRNAWKFSSQSASPRIELGVTEQAGKRVYFVRDNGAGFDMAYSDKLFGAFQRLHDSAEFPGAGIGLAIVHRVVRRHGGRIWAEAEVGKGATFYFTLSNTAPATGGSAAP